MSRPSQTLSPGELDARLSALEPFHAWATEAEMRGDAALARDRQAMVVALGRKLGMLGERP
jgi:hypothetical protein